MKAQPFLETLYTSHACKPVYEVRELQNEVNGLETAFV